MVSQTHNIHVNVLLFTIPCGLCLSDVNYGNGFYVRKEPRERMQTRLVILTTNLAAVVCVSVSVCAKCEQFLPKRSHFDSKRPEIFVRIATFQSATFGPLFSFHCPLFVTKNNNLEW